LSAKRFGPVTTSLGKIALELEGIRKSFGDLLVLKEVSLSLRAAETVAIIGPSGSGKSTLLNIVAGLTTADEGRVLHARGADQPIGYMMQDSLLLPWRTLWKNAMLGAEIVGVDPKMAEKECAAFFEELGLNEARSYLPAMTSGGMARRAAFIRTLVAGPAILLLDEPFSGLDYDIKIRTQRLLLREQQRAGWGILLVTHDIEDAIALADRLLVLSEKPTFVKREFSIDRGGGDQDPLQIRSSESFGRHFAEVLSELRYLNDAAS